MRRVITGCRVILQPQLCGGSDCKYSMIWVNYNISLTWINAIWGWFPLSTMIPVRSQWGRYNLPRMIYSMYSNWPSCHTSQSIQDIEASCFAKSMSSMFGARWCQVPIGELVPKMNTWLKKQKKKQKLIGRTCASYVADHGSAPVDLERDRSELKVTANHLGSNARRGPKRIKHGVSLTSDWFIVISFIL